MPGCFFHYINYSYFVDAEILEDVSDYEGLKDINQGYLDIAESLELIPTQGIYIVPYVANAAGVLYNKDMFAEHGWQIPETWGEMQQPGALPDGVCFGQK